MRYVVRFAIWVGLTAVAFFAGFVYHSISQAQRSIEEITQPPAHRNLSQQEIKQKLASGSFREKLEARRWISKLPEQQRLALMEELLSNPQEAVRIMAVVDLGQQATPSAQALLERAASGDVSARVRGRALHRVIQARPKPSPAFLLEFFCAEGNLQLKHDAAAALQDLECPPFYKRWLELCAELDRETNHCATAWESWLNDPLRDKVADQGEAIHGETPH